MISDRTLTTGDTFVATYKKAPAKVFYDPDLGSGGKPFVGVLPAIIAGSSFSTLSDAAKRIAGCNCNGWRFFRREDGDGTVRPAAQAEAPPKKKAAAARPVRVKQIKKMPNQKAVEDGKVKWFCSACMSSFLVDGTEAPEACPEGHPLEVDDEFASVPRAAAE